MASSVPAILIGVSKVMGGRVAPRLAPEIEVIQFITSVERAKAEIPALRAGRGQDVPNDPDNVGTHNFSRPPEIVIFGRGFGPEQVEEIHEGCGGSASGLAWLQTEAESRAKVMARPPDAKGPEGLDGYADQISATVKKVVAGLKAEGKLGVDGMYTYV